MRRRNRKYLQVKAVEIRRETSSSPFENAPGDRSSGHETKRLKTKFDLMPTRSRVTPKWVQRASPSSRYLLVYRRMVRWEDSTSLAALCNVTIDWIETETAGKEVETERPTLKHIQSLPEEET